MIAAWALGRMGGVQAIPSLRNAFTSAKYRSVRAHAARALGTLGDRESIPLLLEEVRNNPDLGIKVACGSSLGKLQVTEATSDLLHILYIDSSPQSRREMGLSLARLLDAEGKYIELSRAIYEDPGTALAQEIDVIRGIVSKKFAEQEDILLQLVEAREQFALGQLEQGFQPLRAILHALAEQEVDSPCRQILAETRIRMYEFGPSRMEYPILGIVALEKCVK